MSIDGIISSVLFNNSGGFLQIHLYPVPHACVQSYYYLLFIEDLLCITHSAEFLHISFPLISNRLTSSHCYYLHFTHKEAGCKKVKLFFWGFDALGIDFAPGLLYESKDCIKPWHHTSSDSISG